MAHLEVQFFFPMDVALFASDVDQLSQLLGELGEAQLGGREVGCLSKGKGSEENDRKEVDFFLDLMTFYGDVTDVTLCFRLFMDVTL